MGTGDDAHAGVGEEVIEGRYRVVARLGAGSMGVVYKAEDLFLGRTVAIKVVDSAHGGDAAMAERFLEEARALAQVRHDNVVQVYAFGPHGTSFYFAMEYVEGRSLEDVIDEHTARGETMEVAAAMPILRQVARGLGAVHARRLVHRDVKPGNIVIEDGTGRPVLVDFGLARGRRPASPRLTMISGTPAYIAPEQVQAADGTSVTYRADIYALACTAFEMLSGKPVFDAPDVHEILCAQVHTVAPAPSSIRPELAPFDAAIARSLAKNPDHRHDSCEALIAELDIAARRLERVSRISISPGSARRSAQMVRVVLLAEDGVARPVERHLERLLRDHGMMPVCERVTSAREALASCQAGPVRLVIVDEDVLEDTIGFARELAHVARARGLELVVVARDVHAARARVGAFGVREILPKPLNPHVLGSVLGRVIERGEWSVTA